jgi:DNA invertase Pin-like site-specific DNA recombinase
MRNKDKKAVAYVRVSGLGQVNGTGFDRQEDCIRFFCKNQSIDLTEIYKESHTGTEGDRPVFHQMIEDLLSNGKRTIVVESLDRLARDLSVQMQLLSFLIAHKITLLSATTGQNVTEAMQSDPMLKAMVQIQGTFAELEKSLLVRKLKKARIKVKEQKGRCEGRKPFGFYPGEKETVERMRQLYRKPPGRERRGFYQIATILNREGYQTRSGKPWHGGTIKRILLKDKL